MSSKPFFEWADGLPLSTWIRDSSVLFPLVEVVHILALTVLLGSIVLLSMRLMGAGLKQLPVKKLAITLAPFTNWALVAMLLSGAVVAAAPVVPAYGRVALLALKSPHFLYTELPARESDATRTATRLAFALWDSAPDAELARAATAGRLRTREEVAAQATRLLADPRARARVPPPCR